MARSKGSAPVLLALLAYLSHIYQVSSNPCGQQSDEISLEREQIFVKIDNGTTFSLLMEPEDTLHDLRQDIYELEGMSGQRMQLQLGDTKLDYVRKLSDYNINAGTTVSVVFTRNLDNCTVKFNVRTRDGRDLPVEAQLGSSVSSLRYTISQMTGIAQTQLRLLVRGKELKDERKLINYDIYDRITVNLGEPLDDFRQAVLILVKTPSGATLEVEVSLADTVSSLKEKIWEKAGVPTGVQRLFANERFIAGEDHLCDLGLEDGSSVYMYLHSSRITSLDQVSRLQGPPVACSVNPSEAPIFREVDQPPGSGHRISIYKDTRNWVTGPRPGWVPELFDPVAKLVPNPDGEFWVKNHQMVLDDYTSPNASEQQQVEAAIIRAQMKLSLSVRPYRVAANISSENKPRLEPGITLGGGFADASLGRPIPLGADVDNWAPDNFSDADLMRLFELSERVRRVLAKAAQTGEGLLSVASQRRINRAIRLTYYEALAGYPPLVEYNQEQGDEVSCAICQDDLTAEPASKLACGHKFHTDCIHTWVNNLLEEEHAPSCPNCRQRFMFPYAAQGKTELETKELQGARD